jgi:hypothetical protein
LLLQRLFIFLSLPIAFVFAAYDKPLFDEYETTLISVEKNLAVIEDSSSIMIGSSGIVIYSFDNEESLIISRAIVTSKNGTKAMLELLPFDNLAQNNFPRISVVPKAGDIVKLNYLYGRSLIVAPNYEAFKKITDFFIDMEWIHPDITAAFLAKRYIPNPDRKRFREMCSINMAGLITFNMDDFGYFVDCISFKVVKAFKMPLVSDLTIVPFYSRISDNVKTSPLVLGNKEIIDYSGYYKHLLGVK